MSFSDVFAVGAAVLIMAIGWYVSEWGARIASVLALAILLFAIWIKSDWSKNIKGWSTFVLSVIVVIFIVVTFLWPKLSVQPSIQEPAPRPSPPASVPTRPAVQLAPTFGNLKERTLALSQEIMEDLSRHGWREKQPVDRRSPNFHMPDVTDIEGLQKWIQTRSIHFRFRFLNRVIDLRNEFSQLHLRDERLDRFIESEGMIEQANQMMRQQNLAGMRQIDILPQQIEEVAERLVVLANQIKSQLTEEEQPTNFKLSLRGGNVFVAGIDFRLIGLVLDVEIRNAGKASIATDWKLLITVPGETPIPAQLTEPPPHLSLSGEHGTVTFPKSAFSLEKEAMSKPIEYGSPPLKGKLLFYVELQKDKLANKNTILELSVSDLSGNIFSTTQRYGDWLSR
jgi:hypothetical protein